MRRGCLQEGCLFVLVVLAFLLILLNLPFLVASLHAAHVF